MTRHGNHRILRVLAGLCVLALLGFAAELLWAAGFFKSITPHFAGTCRPLTSIVGGEDVVLHPKTGVAYVASCHRRELIAGTPKPGAVWAIDMREPELSPVNVTPDAGDWMQPHGIGLWVADDGQPDSLYVVTHPIGGHAIEVFDLVAGGGVERRSTLTDPLLSSPNDALPVARDRLYVSIDHGTEPETFGRTLEEYLRLRLGTIIYFDGASWRTAADGLAYPNGLAATPDGRTVYVAASTMREVHVYDRDAASGDLTPRDVFETGTGVDNIHIAADGALWIGAHPKLLDFAAHWADADARSASQVIRLVPRPGGGADVTEVLLDAGDGLSGSSAAVNLGRKLLVGPVLDPRMLDCTMDVPL